MSGPEAEALTSGGRTPKRLISEQDRQMARRIRDGQWDFMARVASLAPEPLWWCIWNKDRHHTEELPDLYVNGLIDGLELNEWMSLHPEWWIKGEWSDERYARPVWLTDAGRAALANREPYDMEPVTGGLVEPGWVATPSTRREPSEENGTSDTPALPPPNTKEPPL